MSLPPRALGYVLACNLISGVSYVAMAWSLRGFDAAAGTFWRLFLGGLLFVPAARGAWRHTRISRGDWARMATVGVLGLAAPLMIGSAGLKLSTATNASLLVGLEPVSILVLAALFLGERLTGVKLAAIACGLTGSAVIALQGLPWNAAVTPHWRGDVLLALHAMFWAIYTVAGKSALERVPAVLFTALTTWIAAGATLLFTLGRPWPQSPPPFEAWAALLFQGVCVTFGATLLWNKALELIPASTMANFVFLQPLTGVLVAVLLGEGALTAWSALGGALVLAGVVLASR